MKIFSKNTWGVDVNNAWPLTRKASCLKKIELRPLISGFDFALLEVRNLCVASRLRRKGSQNIIANKLKVDNSNNKRLQYNQAITVSRRKKNIAFPSQHQFMFTCHIFRLNAKCSDISGFVFH